MVTFEFQGTVRKFEIQIFININSIKTYDFSTLYTTIPQDKLNSMLFDIIDSFFFNKNESHKIPTLSSVICKTISLKNIQIVHTSTLKWKLKECLSFNIYVVFWNQDFQHSVGIFMGTNCNPLLVDIFLHYMYYEAEWFKKNLNVKKNHSL